VAQNDRQKYISFRLHVNSGDKSILYKFSLFLKQVFCESNVLLSKYPIILQKLRQNFQMLMK